MSQGGEYIRLAAYTKRAKDLNVYILLGIISAGAPLVHYPWCNRVSDIPPINWLIALPMTNTEDIN